MEAPLVAIIEDDTDVLCMITDCLEAEGYRVLAYPQGAGAYEFIEHARPDAVVLDVRMEHPRAGMAVLQRLRRDEATVETPIVVCTADVAFTREWARTLAEHRCAVITKPFRIADLLAAITRLTDASLDEPAPTAAPGRRAKVIPEPVIRPVVGLVDADGKGVTSHTAQLEQKGYKVVACRWGDGILDMAVREQPDVMMVDPGGRPGGAVSFALRRVGHHPLTGHIPVVVDPPQGGAFYRRIEEIVGPAPASKPSARQA